MNSLFACVPFEFYWNGEKFLPYAPYPSWVWNDELIEWQPPVQLPSLVEEGMMWVWNENTLSWEAKPNEEDPIH